VLTIKPELLAAFEPDEVRQFVERNVARLREHFPELAEQTDADLGAMVRLALERAAEHGVRNAYDVTLYVGVMAMLGRDFDRDGRHAWAEGILATAGIDPTTKMEWLYQRAGTETETRAEVVSAS